MNNKNHLLKKTRSYLKIESSHLTEQMALILNHLTLSYNDLIQNLTSHYETQSHYRSLYKRKRQKLIHSSTNKSQVLLALTLDDSSVPNLATTPKFKHSFS